jgi:hypothetical protein
VDYGSRGAKYASDYDEPTHTGTARAVHASDLERFFDAHLEGPGIWKWRHYFPIYERHLAGFRGAAVDLVEVGVYSGGSLEMWHYYLGSGTNVFGVDVEPACMQYEAPGTRIFIGDQADSAFWERFLLEVPSMDIVIDDGGHEVEQQIATLEALLPALRPGGVYLCEDIHGPGHGFHAYVDGLRSALHKTGDADFDIETKLWARSIDSIHTYPFVTVIEKRERPLDRLQSFRRGTQWQPFYEVENES